MSSDISNVEFYNNYLLKRSMGIVSSGANVAFYDEHLIGKDKFSKHLLNENIPSSLLNYDANVNYDISGVHYDTTWSSSVFTENGLQRSYSASVKNTGDQANKSFGEIFPDSNIEMYKHVNLEPYRKITGTNHRVWAAYDADGNNLLEDAINYNFANDGSYLPILEYNENDNTATDAVYKQINMFTDPLFWLMDDVNGTITFFNSDASLNDVNIRSSTNTSIAIKKTPRLTFYRYVGDRGFDNLDMSGNIKVTGTLEVSDDVIIRDKLDVSGVDISNNLIVSGTIETTGTFNSGEITSTGDVNGVNGVFSGDLTVSGNEITFGNSGKIDNLTNGKIKITATTTETSGSISCTSLNAGSGTIQTTGKLSIGDWQIKYEGTDNSLRIGSNNSNIASGNENVMIFDQNGKVNLEHTTNLLSNSSGGSNIIEGNSGTTSYNANTKTVICTGHTSTITINQYFPVIDENTEHTISITLKNLVAVGTVSSGKYFYCGVQSLNANYSNIGTDEYGTYNYGVASSYAMTSENVPIGTTKTFTGTFKGFNSTTSGATGNSNTKFDPGAEYFRIVIFLNYDGENSNKVEIMDVRYISNNKQNLTAKDITSITTKNYVDQITPIGSVIAWHQQSHRSIPFGWALCDGEFVEGYGYTPDLRGRFILGSGTGSGLTSRTHGDTGGHETHTLTINEMPAHNHTMDTAGIHNHTVTGGSHNHVVDGGSHKHTVSGGSHTHTVSSNGSHSHSYQHRQPGTFNQCIGGDGDCTNRNIVYYPNSFPSYTTGSAGSHNHTVSGGSHTHTVSSTAHTHTVSNTEHTHTVGNNGSHTHAINNKGGGGAHNIMPPFFTLVYIIKVF